jgi:hypothetical protein
MRARGKEGAEHPSFVGSLVPLLLSFHPLGSIYRARTTSQIAVNPKRVRGEDDDAKMRRRRILLPLRKNAKKEARTRD